MGKGPDRGASIPAARTLVAAVALCGESGASRPAGGGARTDARNPRRQSASDRPAAAAGALHARPRSSGGSAGRFRLPGRGPGASRCRPAGRGGGRFPPPAAPRATGLLTPPLSHLARGFSPRSAAAIFRSRPGRGGPIFAALNRHARCRRHPAPAARVPAPPAARGGIAWPSFWTEAVSPLIGWSVSRAITNRSSCIPTRSRGSRRAAPCSSARSRRTRSCTVSTPASANSPRSC